MNRLWIDGRKDAGKGRYLRGETLIGPIVEEKFWNFEMIFLCCHIKGSKAILDGEKERLLRIYDDDNNNNNNNNNARVHSAS